MRTCLVILCLAARASDPVIKQHKQLELAFTKTTTSITRMIEDFQAQLITIDEPRERMPDKRSAPVRPGRQSGIRPVSW
jgi:hypothetical protein